MTTSSPPTAFDRASMSASSWGSRLAGLRSHRVPDGDPRIAQCQAGLAYWRLRNQLDRETAAGHLTADFAAAVEAKFREYPYAGIAEHITPDPAEAVGSRVQPEPVSAPAVVVPS